jgi:hypothetical protein
VFHGQLTAQKLWLGTSTLEIEGSPPWITIDVPPSVECPSTVDLDVSLGDTEEDYASKRWLVDGVLLPHDTEELEFTAGHELTVLLRDERGATASATKAVSCE